MRTHVIRVVMFHCSIDNLHDYPGNAYCIKTNFYKSLLIVISLYSAVQYTLPVMSNSVYWTTILIRLFLLILYMHFSMSIFHYFTISWNKSYLLTWQRILKTHLWKWSKQLWLWEREQTHAIMFKLYMQPSPKKS